MRFLTKDESEAWSAAAGFSADPPKLPGVAAEQLPHLRVATPTAPGTVLQFCRTISRLLAPRSSCLLWVVTWGVWSSSENWHLYYRVRQSYSDYRLIHEAPGHLFLGYEEPDFVTYLELALMSGWDVHVLPDLDYGGAETARAFVSHDEWVLLAHRDEDTLEEWRAELGAAGHPVLPAPAA
ncbi:MAG TPA: hypothetical protein VJU82_15090 [Acidobacteriaceae bacterium]|nr:hypothetical protein [Acidobacteriaceae bacterium]